MINFESEQKIFEIFKPYGICKLSDLSEKDLKEFLYLLSDTFIEPREVLGLPKEATFGPEIEVEHIKIDIARLREELIERFPGFGSVLEDASLINGAEIIPRILKDTPTDWKTLREVTKFLKARASIGKNCSGHIHYGAHMLGDDVKAWLHFFLLYGVNEFIIDRFCSGEYLTARPYKEIFAKPVSLDFIRAYEAIKGGYTSFEDVLYELKKDRNSAVNLRSVIQAAMDKFMYRNTIEFRSPDGTLDQEILQNNINLFGNIFAYCKDIAFDEERWLEQMELAVAIDVGHEEYNKIYLRQTLIFCDSVFKYNIDKIFFLVQYLKRFIEIYNIKDKSKILTPPKIKLTG